MKRVKFYICTALFFFGCSNSFADPIARKNNIGQLYPTVRQELINAGDVPVKQGKYNYGACIMVDDVCSLYPEVMDCAENSTGKYDVICGFEWKSRSGRRYTISTGGEHANTLVVLSISVTPIFLLTHVPPFIN